MLYIIYNTIQLISRNSLEDKVWKNNIDLKSILEPMLEKAPHLETQPSWKKQFKMNTNFLRPVSFVRFSFNDILSEKMVLNSKSIKINKNATRKITERGERAKNRSRAPANVQKHYSFKAKLDFHEKNWKS